MRTALIAAISLLSIFTVLGLLCAVWVALRRGSTIGRCANWANPTPADPYFHPFGEMPSLTAEQLDRIRPRDFSHDPLRRSLAARNALDLRSGMLQRFGYQVSAGDALRSADADGGGHVPSWLAPISGFFARLVRRSFSECGGRG